MIAAIGRLRAGHLAGLVVFLVLSSYNLSQGATYTISPSTVGSDEEFENIANRLQPGDELVLKGGTYSQSSRRAITANGSASNPIVIRAATGETPVLTRPADNLDTQNNIEIVDSSYLILRGLVFKGGNTGVRIIRGHHVTLENSEIADTGNNALTMNSGDTYSLTIRRNHIHHTGLSSSGSTEGEGMYIGCNDAKCRVTDSLIEGNYIHHLRATSEGGNDGIEMKPGSANNIIRDNVIHDTNIGQQFPCIFVYGGGSAVNIVEGNALWNCGEGIQVVSDALVRNNIVLNSSFSGISTSPHVQIAQMRNVTIVNNTIVGHPNCLYIRWGAASNMVLATNAAYCGGRTAVNAAGLSGSGITVQGNVVEGSLSGASIDGTRFLSGGSTASTFRDVAEFDFWPLPGSALIGRARSTWAPGIDFNRSERIGPFDVGAYEADGASSNPGWRIVAGFKALLIGDAAPPSSPRNLRVQ